MPAIIEDESDDNIVPLTSLRRSPRAHTAPLTTNAHTRLHAYTAHMINCVIAEHVLTATQLPPPSTTTPTRRQGYALAAHLLHHNEHHSAETTAEHFIGAVLDDDTGAALEYQHLIKSEKYRSIWVHSFANELGDCSRAYATYLAQTHVSSSRNFKSRHTSAPPTVASAATIAYKRKRSIALD